MEDEEKSLGYEINRLKAHSEQMMKDQVDLQAEVDALDKHMANLNNQNYCLQKELEAFIESDEAVRQGLDRKNKVDNIRNKVDDVIRRSEQEVEERILEQKSRRAHAEHARVAHEQHRAAAERAAVHHDAMSRVTRYEVPVEHRSYVTKSANHYSPVRHESYVSRVAYRGADEAKRGPSAEHNIQTRTFSSDQNRLGVHEYRPSTAVHASTAATRERHSPLRRSAEKKPAEERKVSFA